MRRLLLLAASSLLLACATDEAPQQTDDLTSKHATLLELSFEGEVIAEATDSEAEIEKAVVAQLFYLSGELDKTHGAHGQFAFVDLETVAVEPLEDELTKLTYRAKLPVAWPKDHSVPETYRVVVPLSVEPGALEAFNEKYEGSCAKAKYGTETLWYDFKPVSTEGCAIDPADVLDVEAEVALHPKITEDKRPEIERFWDDGELHFVLVHGTDSASSYDPDDTGVRQYDELKEILREQYPEAVEETGATNYDIYDDWRFETTIPRIDGGEGKLVVHTLLARAMKYAGSHFDERFAALSYEADVVTYGGHSGLSKNIKALAAKESVQPEHYQVWFFDGCSTFAYLDRTLVDHRIEVNGPEIDPEGTKFLDVIVNAQPAPWYTGADSQWAVLRHLADDEHHSFMEIMTALGSSATPVVSGEEDNPSLGE